MGRPKKTDTPEVQNPEVKEINIEQPAPEVEEIAEVENTAEDALTKTEEQPAKTTEAKESLPANVVEKMRLYPQYEELWITPRGFVHPLGVPQYLLKDAKRYKNIFYNK